MNSAVHLPAEGLVLVAPGGLAGTAAGSNLAALLGLRPLLRSITAADAPDALLTGLTAEPAGWLLPLGLDPGQDLEGTGCWAEALAAWRQPALLLVPVDADAPLPAGCARAYAALLQLSGVPCLGLVQLGGDTPPQPQRDDLPWLGWLDPLGADDETGEALAQALRLRIQLRWRDVSAARPDPPMPDPADAAARQA